MDLRTMSAVVSHEIQVGGLDWGADSVQGSKSKGFDSDVFFVVRSETVLRKPSHIRFGCRCVQMGRLVDVPSSRGLWRSPFFDTHPTPVYYKLLYSI